MYKIFNWKTEGAASLNGLNVYHPKDSGSAGFVIKLGRFQAGVRYSKVTKKLRAIWIR